MNFEQYRKMKRLAISCKDVKQFLRECERWPVWYGVPGYLKKDYEIFFDRVHGGLKYEDLHKSA